MVANKKKTQSEEEDRISQLPDPLLGDILNRLPTEESVRTSCLSTRWRNLWSLVPDLELDSCKFSDLDAFVSFADRFFDTQRKSGSCLRKLDLFTHYPHGRSSLLPWLDSVTTRNIQHLNIFIHAGCFECHEVPLIPLSLYTSKTLVHLQLSNVVLVDAEYFSLPSLKVMKLSYVRCYNEATLEKLILGSPVLEDFRIMRYFCQKGTELQVRSQSLKRINITHLDNLAVIDAPRLQCLTTSFHKTKNYKIISSGFPAQVDIDFGGVPILVIHDILTEISEVRDLAITTYQWKNIFPSLGPVIQFCYLSRLRASFSASNLEVLPNLLECCPILESLILEMCHEPKTMCSTVPPCLVSSLKFVELRFFLWKYHGGELNLARYFLKNSTILEKLSVWFNKISSSHDILKEHLIAMPRYSSTCQVVVCSRPV